MTHKEFNEILETETNNGIDLLMQKMRGLEGKSQTEQIANMICLSREVGLVHYDGYAFVTSTVLQYLQRSCHWLKRLQRVLPLSFY